jgi:predicted lysophospholipase L1 biosynthesis ABC-type transport system permease subunit
MLSKGVVRFPHGKRRWIVWGYLLISLCNAALALLWANDRLLHAIIAALWVLSAVAFLLKKWPPSVDGSIS